MALYVIAPATCNKSLNRIGPRGCTFFYGYPSSWSRDQALWNKPTSFHILTSLFHMTCFIRIKQDWWVRPCPQFKPCSRHQIPEIQPLFEDKLSNLGSLNLHGLSSCRTHFMYILFWLPLKLELRSSLDEQTNFNANFYFTWHASLSFLYLGLSCMQINLYGTCPWGCTCT